MCAGALLLLLLACQVVRTERWSAYDVIISQVCAVSFEDWALDHGKTYGPAERQQRKAIFEANARKVAQLNEESRCVSVWFGGAL